MTNEELEEVFEEIRELDSNFVSLGKDENEKRITLDGDFTLSQLKKLTNALDEYWGEI